MSGTEPSEAALSGVRDVRKHRSQEGKKRRGWGFHLGGSGYLHGGYRLNPTQFLRQDVAGRRSREMSDDGWEWEASRPQLRPVFSQPLALVLRQIRLPRKILSR